MTMNLRIFRKLVVSVALGAVLGRGQPALQPVRVHTNMIGLVQSPDVNAARGFLGITGYVTGSSAEMQVATLADLAGITRSNGLPMMVVTRGFATDGDEGGAVYLWRNTSGTTNLLRVAAAGGGQWWELEYLQRGIINILKTGAKPKQDVDSFPALDAAFKIAMQQDTNSSGLLKFGDEPTVYIPRGFYRNKTGTVYAWAAGGRGTMAINVIGDGPDVSILYHEFDSGPMLAMDRFRGTVAGFTIYNGLNPTYYGRAGIYTYDWDYAVMRDLKFINLAYGLCLNNPNMNYNLFDRMDFEGCMVDILGMAMQGSSFNGVHSTSGRHFLFGYATGLYVEGHVEGKPYRGVHDDEFFPAMFIIPSGNKIDVSLGYYNENGGSLFMLGLPTTNRVTLTNASGVITATLTNLAIPVSGQTVRLDPDLGVDPGSLPSDVQAYILGNRVLTGGDITNSTRTFNAGGTVTSDLSPYKFLMVYSNDNAGVVDARLWASVRDPTLRFAIMDKVMGVRLIGAGSEYYDATERSVNVEALGPPNFRGNVSWPVEVSRVRPVPVPLNVFPDPELQTGTNWMRGVLTSFGNGVLIPTNYLGEPALLFYATNRVATLYPQFRADFQPTVPMGLLEGARLGIGAELVALNHPDFKPLTWSIQNGGTGYTNGEGTVTAGGRTVTVTVTTDAGAITNVAWYFGSFATNNGIGPLTVTQGAASGGQITPLTFTNLTWEIQNYAGKVTLATPGGSTAIPGSGNVTIMKGYSWRDPATGHYRYMQIGKPSDPLGTYTALRVWVSDSAQTTEKTTGNCVYLIRRLWLLVNPEPGTLPQTVLRYRTRSPYETLVRFGNAGRFGTGWPGPENTNTFALFGGATDNVVGPRVQLGSGIIGSIPIFLKTTSPPTGAMSGTLMMSNTTVYIFNGSNWLPLN